MEKQCTVLIVEDEEIERQSLISILQGYFKDTIKVYAAAHALEALELYKRFHHDIVLSDIEMPGMNGLQLIEELKKENLLTIFYIVTSYDDFSYAQKAIQLGIEDFILKPVTPTQIIKTIAKAIGLVKTQQNQKDAISTLFQRYGNIRPILEKGCIYAILTRRGEMEIQKYIKDLNLRVNSGLCFIVSPKNVKLEEIQQIHEAIYDLGYCCIHDYVNSNYIFFVFYSEVFGIQDIQAIEQVITQALSPMAFVGIGSCVESYVKFYDSYVHALRDCQPLNMRIKINYNNMSKSKTEMDEKREQFVHICTEAFRNYKDDIIYIEIRNYAQYLMLYPLAVIEEQVNLMLQAVVKELQKDFKENIEIGQIPKLSIENELYTHTLPLQLVQIFNSLFYPLRSSKKQESSSLVRQIVDYIEQHYEKPISLEEVAKVFSVSPFYVSKIIKNNLGKSFTDIVNECRIEKAKNLLKAHVRIKEVVFCCGFQSQSYFSKMFKKLVGVSPKEYQDMFL